jgi:hypothetical protein
VPGRALRKFFIGLFFADWASYLQTSAHGLTQVPRQPCSGGHRAHFEVQMDSGTWIKQLLEERFIKASDVERLSRSIADAKGNSDYYVSHATLADIAAGSIPSIYKIFSLAISLKLPYEQVLLVFGIDLKEAAGYPAAGEPPRAELEAAVPQTPGFRFQLQFDHQIDPNQTTLLHPDVVQSGYLPAYSHRSNSQQRFRYGLIGLEDRSLGDVIPPGSVVEIDKEQNTVVKGFVWKTLRERPIYFVWHQEGYGCCWCQQEASELTLIPHPVSREPIRRYRMPRDASIIGRVVNAWSPFQSVLAIA